MAAAGKWKMYESAKLAWANGTIDFDSHSFKINLYLSTSNANTLTAATITQLSDITNQVATNFGYTQNTKAVTITTANSSGTITIDETTNPVWTASGGSITARFAVIYDDSHANDMPIAVCLLDTAPADVTATDGNTFTITMNASGILTLSGAATD
jgi:hypothetical protein